MLIYILHPQTFKYLEWADSSSFCVFWIPENTNEC